MGVVSVKFNNIALSPTPTVSREYQFIDYGGRYGQIEQISLNSFITGITTPMAALNSLASVYGGQFRTLEVLEDSTSIYKWDNAVVQEVNVPSNTLSINGFTPYNVKLIAYQIPSGVLDQSNEYSFAQNGDGTVTVNHKISARGIKNATGALDNAINFVKNFVRKNPFTSCAPTFIPNSSGILSNISESIDRASCSYSVTEVYKYATGSSPVGCIQTDSLSIDDSKTNDYLTIDLSVKLQGSPVDSNIEQVQAAATSLSIDSVLQSYGLVTTGIFRNTFSLTEQTGDSSVEIKASFLSGINGADYSGYLDYTVSMDKDFVPSISTWRLEGDFTAKGPLTSRKTKLAAFKTANQAGGYLPFITGLITGSALWGKFGEYNLTPTQVNISENTGLATLRISAAFSNLDTLSGLVQPKYSVEVDPPRWIYEVMPSANIEGHYVVQDLQMKNQGKIRLSANAGTSGTKVSDISIMSGIISSLSGIYVDQATVTSETITSGFTNVEAQFELLGTEKRATAFLTSKVYGSFGNDYVRPKGYKFGY